MNKKQKNKKYEGFTLLEMLIVMFVIAILIVLFVPNLMKQTDGINKKGDIALEKVIETQSEMYYLDKESRPTSTKELFDGGYISKEQKKKADELEIKVK
ncbi:MULTISPECIES: competence type IV pilus major pilin ComGC [Vagococcus]|uniref:Late competence protein ComGC, access of DNA to ComEA, FIG007487 n=1 Tax=Vagococcus fluvialis bH819 TaxID=1255619 RepID=A0A1X6WMJ4_9ENTE|nr:MULTISPECIES: competence type IV pilus major pilin ComGC [Vagococcus]SLM85544.1 Late competence protein ComGC, access of DNA to ComEA, FIG007487 [Vagococcus fluvialis bH819]HCM89511.1 prepilin-type N-terminal cleavage/methylation domain-containing protein [Vagococcus sp.]